MLLTIQIVNFNSRDELASCLCSVEENISDKSNLQVVIVNNDGEKLGSFPGGFSLETIEKNENVGFGKAHNLGFRRAKGKYVLFLNPDAKIFPGTIEALLDAFAGDEKIGIASPIHVGENDISGEEHFGRRKTPLSMIWTKISGMKRDIGDGIFETDWVSGGAMMVKKDLFSELGGFDENFFMYFEDVDLCLRAKKKGWKVAVQPRAKIFHKSGQSFSSARQKKKHYYASQAHYVRKNFGLFLAWTVRALRFPLYMKNVYFSRK
jgi:GT2 family glycosyltransferase